ncbi:MAG TPA: CoA transferase [Candidatus Sulfotelmatobacter sp.]|nr:CoA transferase [Candidatus Sulfotelmatobacter sp.]
MDQQNQGPLQGLRILDIATVLAAPWSATLLADLGAEVLKVEMPGRGDLLRALAPHKDGVPLWWKVANRNKKAITLDLRKEAGRALLEKLLPRFDVLVENFRPGTLDGWGLPKERLFAIHPKLTVLRVSGFGQTGPYRDRPAFARVAEAIAGFTYICGEAGGAPLHMGFPVADAVAGLFGAVGILGALYRRQREPEAAGQEIDVNLAEATFRMLDFLPIEYDQLGVVRGRTGNLSDYSAPSNVHRTRDEVWITIPASSQGIFERLCRALGEEALIRDPRFASNAERVRNRATLDAIIAAAIATRTLAELRPLLDRHEVGWSAIHSIADVFADPHFQAREAIVSVPDDELGPVRMQNVTPRFSGTPGRVASTGPALGQHNAEVYGQWLGLGEQERAALQAAGVI